MAIALLALEAARREACWVVHLAVAGPDGCFAQARRYGDSRGREWVRRLSAGDALDQLRLRLQTPMVGQLRLARRVNG